MIPRHRGYCTHVKLNIVYTSPMMHMCITNSPWIIRYEFGYRWKKRLLLANMSNEFDDYVNTFNSLVYQFHCAFCSQNLSKWKADYHPNFTQWNTRRILQYNRWARKDVAICEGHWYNLLCYVRHKYLIYPTCCFRLDSKYHLGQNVSASAVAMKIAIPHIWEYISLTDLWII